MSAPLSQATSANNGVSWVQATVSGAPEVAAARKRSNSARQNQGATVTSLRRASGPAAPRPRGVVSSDLADFAVVLEPDEPLRLARRAFYAGMVALADALAAHAPPEKPMSIDWPDAIRVDGGLIGGGRLAWPDGADENEPPQWLVFGAMIRTVAMGEDEPGLPPLSSALEAEGFDDLGSGRLVESFARHLMVATDAWREKGYGEIAKSYLARLAPATSGVGRQLAEN